MVLEEVSSIAPGEEFYKVLLERCKDFIKLDFLYLGAAAAIVTALKVGRGEWLQLGQKFGWPVLAVLFVFGYDVIIEREVFKSWYAKQAGIGSARTALNLRFWPRPQSYLHFFLVGGLLAFAIAFSWGAGAARREVLAEVWVQEEVDAYVSAHGVAPQSIDALPPSSKLARAKQVLEKRPFSIEAGPGTAYALVFSGSDAKSAPTDTLRVSSGFKLRQVYERMRRDDDVLAIGDE